MEHKLSKGSKLFITEGLALFSGIIYDTEFHSHHAIQISIGMEKNFIVEADSGKTSSRFMILNSNFKHRLSGEQGIQVLLLVEPESEFGAAVLKLLDNRHFIANDAKDLAESVDFILQSKEMSISKIIILIFKYLGITVQSHNEMDERISRVISIINDTMEKKISVKELSDHVNLSESRLQHLFKKNTGISIKYFLLWKRIIDGINIITSGKDFTFSSYEAGFSDSAHMSRAFKDMFGIKLSDIFKDSRSVQVIRCKD
jgi:AraC-like DNA-binding protein